jgi:hypothetical protein
MAECCIGEAAVTAIGGHGEAVATVSTGCIHEHVTRDVPVCAACLDRHVKDPLCCVACELRKPRHCCPLVLDVKLLEGVTWK